MGKLACIAVFLFSVGIIVGQENIQKGDLLILGNTSSSGYQHIDFPKKNIIIKKGAIAKFYALIRTESYSRRNSF
jgi:hypothetical protein